MSSFRLKFKSKLLFLRLGSSLKRDAVRPQLNVLEAAYNNRTKSNDDDDVPLVVDRYIVCNSSTIVERYLSVLNNLNVRGSTAQPDLALSSGATSPIFCNFLRLIR